MKIHVTKAEVKDASFGAFDGVVSVAGFVFALLVHKSSRSTIAVGGVGGAIAATVSMASGTFSTECDSILAKRIQLAVAMAIGSAIGSVALAWPFFAFNKPAALAIGGAQCLAIASAIAYAKHKGAAGYVETFATLIAAIGLTLLIVSAIPSS